MNHNKRRKFLQADINAAQAMLGELGPGDVLERVGLEHRLKEASEELQALANIGTVAEAVLTFDGEPVVRSIGIDAKFASAALTRFQDLVAKVQSTRQRGTLKSSGPVPDERAARLHVTDVAYGSFGFELQEIPEQSPILLQTSLADSLVEAANLIAAAGSDDDVFEDAIAGVNTRVKDSVASFIQLMSEWGAACKIASGRKVFALNRDQVPGALERTNSVLISEEPKIAHGTFLGVLGDSRRFELMLTQGDQIVRGNVDISVNDRTLSSWASMYGKECTARLRVVTTIRHDKPTVRHFLEDIELASG